MVFDFDGTLAKTEARTFSDFSNLALIEKASPTVFATVARNLFNLGFSIVVLTARTSRFGIRGAIRSFANRSGFDCKVIGVEDILNGKRVEGKNGKSRKMNRAEKKAFVLGRFAVAFGKVAFWDDDQANVDEARKACKNIQVVKA